MENKNYNALRTIYQHCCDCQDLAESIEDWTLMRTFENLRRELNNKMFGYNL